MLIKVVIIIVVVIKNSNKNNNIKKLVLFSNSLMRIWNSYNFPLVYS